jgi:imidazolonepropionase-like amidohydrolase
LIVVAGCGGASARPEAPRAEPLATTADAILFDGAQVFDGERFAELDVLVEGARITHVAPEIEAPTARHVDGAGHTLLPGLIDAHTHAGMEPRSLRLAAAFGVTLEVDLFGPPHRLGPAREAEREGQGTELADLRGAGTLATVPGGHGTEYGIPIPTLSQPEEADAFVAARLAEGSDYLKIVYDHWAAPGSDTPFMPTLSLETVRALVTAAHARERLAIVHVGLESDAFDVVSAGADGLAHLFSDRAPRPELVALMVAQHTFVIPTLTTEARGCDVDGNGRTVADDPAIAAWLLEDDLARLRRVRDFDRREACFETISASLRTLRDAGVPILAGTDAINAGTTHGASLHGELAMLVAAGLSIEEALRAATSTPARVLGLEGRGRIVEGARADLVLVEGDVSTDIHATRHIELVLHAGREVPRPAPIPADPSSEE